MPTPTRTHGSLTNWNDERGFGFITPAQGMDKIFVHVSAFPRDGQRPAIGELVSFEVASDAQGRKRALRIARPGGHRPAARPTAHQHRVRHARKANPLGSALTLLAIVAIGVLGYTRLQRPTPAAPTPATTAQPAAALPTNFACDGRKYCSQMHSCAEATQFLKYCPGVQMDGDGDGIPCEQQWCTP